MIITARNAGEVEDVSGKLAAKFPGKVHGCAADVSTGPGRDVLVGFVKSRWESLDLLVNNVGTNARKRIEDASNIVFSNGLLDPWHGGGVLRNLSSSVLAIVLPNGAHHIDLMFTDPADTHYPDIGWAREFERSQIAKWVHEHAQARMIDGKATREEL